MGLLRENARRWGPEEQGLRGLLGQYFGADTPFVVAADEIIGVKNVCGGNELCRRRKG